MSQVGTEVTRVVVMWWLMRNLGPEPFSAWALIFVVTNLASMFVEFGFGTAIIQRAGAEKDLHLISSVYWIQTGVGLLFAVILAVAAPWIAEFYGRANLALVYQICGINFVIAAQASIPRALLQKALKFHQMAIVEIVAEVVASLCALAALPIGWLWPMVVWMLIRSVVKSVMYWWYSGWRPMLTFSLSSIRPILRFCAHLIGAQTIEYGAANFDRVLLGKLSFTGDVLGPYDRAASLTVMPAKAVGRMVGRVMMPVMAKFQQRKEDGLRLILFVLTAVNAFLVPYVAVILLRSDLVVQLVFGEEWIAMAPLMAVFSFVVFLAGFNAIAVSSILALGRADLNLKIGTIGRFAVTLGWGLGSFGGVKGMAVGRSLGAAVMSLALVWALAKATNRSVFQIFYAFRVNLLAFVVAMVAGSLVPSGQSWLLLFLVGGVCGVSAWMVSGIGLFWEYQRIRTVLSGSDEG